MTKREKKPDPAKEREALQQFPIVVTETSREVNEEIKDEIRPFRFFYGGSTYKKYQIPYVEEKINETKSYWSNFALQIANLTGARFKDVDIDNQERYLCYNIYIRFEGTSQQYYDARAMFQGLKMGHYKDPMSHNAIPLNCQISDDDARKDYIQTFYWSKLIPSGESEEPEESEEVKEA
jgi:hypothetical protein